MRKLATVETIAAIKEHSNADALEIALVRGWQVVIRKNEFQPGERVVFFEIDSWIPTELAPFLSKDKEPRVFEGVKGERLKTIRLRGELSQGLILPISILGSYVDFSLEDGTDVSDHLGVIKWELPLPAQLQGQVEGDFPSWIPKTEQNRIQNFYSEMAYLDNYEHGGIDWNVEEKLDGTSCSVFVRFKSDVAAGYYETGVCSRNFQIKINEENKDNTYIKTITDAGYLDHIHKLCQSIAIQGEICGPGIQGNKYKLDAPSFFVFDVYLIDEHRYATFDERMNILKDLFDLGVRVNQVPYLGTCKLPHSIQDCLNLAEGKSQLNSKTEREGLVLKTAYLVEGKMYSFKMISNSFLLKNE